MGKIDSEFEEFMEKKANQIAERTGLSPTRSKVLTLIKLKKDKSEIADMLEVSKQTVQNHIQDIRSEVSFAQELIDIAGDTHYTDETVYKEFGGELWMFRSGMKYQKTEEKRIEKKIYGSPNGSCLLIEREKVSSQGSLQEKRTRTEFYDGNDIPPHLLRKGQFDSYDVAALHTAFIANAGIDPKFPPSKLVSNSVSVPEVPNEFDYMNSLFESSSDGWVTL
jgi:DNA-binding CsgD family transcriptional regulator